MKARLKQWIAAIPVLCLRTFGRVHWEAPPWGRHLSNRFNQGLQWLRSHPKTARKWGIASVMVLLAVGGAIYGYRLIPKPVTVSFQVINPPLNRLVDEKWEVQPLRIQFKSSVAPLHLVNKEVSEGVRISPAIEGKWVWAGDRELRFLPKTDWPIGAKLSVTFAKKGLVAPHVRLEKYSTSALTKPFSAEISKTEFYQDPVDPKIKKVVATISFSHPVNDADFKDRVRMTITSGAGGIDKKMPAHITYDKFKMNAFVHSDPLEIPAKDETMKVTVAEGARAEKSGSPLANDVSKDVKIPGLYSFLQVDSADLSLVENERMEPEQVLILHTSAGVAEKEMNAQVTAYEMPLHHPDKNVDDGTEPYEWNDPEKIGTAELKTARKLDLQPIATAQEYSTTHSYKYIAEVGRYIYVHVNKGLRSFGGYILAKPFDTTAVVPEYPRQLKILSNGSLLSLTGEKKVSLYARDVGTVKFEVGRVLPGQIQHLVTQTSGPFVKPEFLNDYNFNENNISERFSEIQDLQKLGIGKSQYFGFDLGKYLDADGGRRGLFLFKVSGYDRKKKQTTDESDSRLILITDMGLLVKSGVDGSADIFAVSISSGTPVAGVTVQVIGKNGMPVVTQTTDETGRAHFQTLKDFKHERAPALYLAAKDSDLAFLPYARQDRVLNMSRFDVGGTANAARPDQLSAYLFSDRGIYRPGDEIIVGAIVKPASWQTALKDVPLEAVVLDARGLVVKREKMRLPASGFAELRYQTQDNSATGTYTINLHIVKDNKLSGLLGSTTVRVREFLPDRLKISATFSTEPDGGWVSPDSLKGRISLMNLFGTPAADRKVTASIELRPSVPAFPQYKEFIFYDPKTADEKFSEDLVDEWTNDNGMAEFNLGLNRFKEATYRLRFMARGYESEGGRGVAAERSILVSPLERLVGYKADGDLHYVSKDSKRALSFIVIDKALKKIVADDLTVALVERRHVSVLTKQEDGTYKYESVVKETVASEKPVQISEKGFAYSLPTAKPGDWAIELRDASHGALSRVEYSVAGHSNFARSLEKNAELQLLLNKTDYNPGEEIEMEVRAPYPGAGLITIERDKVYTYQWFKTDTTSSVQRITLPAGFEGNGYVSVAFVRDINSHEIFMSPLSYGTVPFSVSLARRTATVTLNVPTKVEPGSPLRMRYKTDRPSQIVVYAIDEGILQVAGYKTPSPLNYFFQKRALEVKTSQILDLILPEFKVLMALSSPGGDEGSDLGKNLNPFKRKQQKPVVYWSGIISADSKERELVYDVPDYFNGSIRVMAVAVAPDAIGVAQKQTEVRGDFVISPNVPTFVAPGDEFEVGVAVANNLVGSGSAAEVAIDMKVPDALEVVGASAATLKIAELKEGAAVFKFRAKDILGSATLVFTAGIGDKKNHIEASTSIRPAVPYMTVLHAGGLKGGSVDVALTRDLYSEFKTRDLGMSALPMALAQGLAGYLEKFEYGCTEQLVSQAVPAVVLQGRPELGYAGEKADKIYATIMPLLQTRQNAEGGFGTWAAVNEANIFASVYALHLLTEAKERNLTVPAEMMTRGTKWLTQIVGYEAESLTDARDLAYALYVLTRQGTVTSTSLAALREWLDAHHEKKWEADLAAAYMASAYQLLKQDKLADDLIRGVAFQSSHQTWDSDTDYYSPLVHNSRLLYLLSKHFPHRLKSLGEGDLQQIAAAVAEGRYNTLSSASTILALDTYVQNLGDRKLEGASASEVLADGVTQPLVLPDTLFPRVAISDKAKSVRIQGANAAPIYYVVTEAGFDRNLPQAAVTQGLEVTHEYTDDAGKAVSQATLGTEVYVHVKLRSLSGYLGNLAVVDLLPGGFEVVVEPPAESEETSPTPANEPSEGEGDVGGEEAEVDEAANFKWVPPIGTSASTWAPDYIDIREDRVILYGSVSTEVKEFIYKIRATNAGTFVTPPTFGESMYNRSVQARSIGGRIVIEKSTADATP